MDRRSRQVRAWVILGVCVLLFLAALEACGEFVEALSEGVEQEGDGD
jgi:hypothetical protein